MLDVWPEGTCQTTTAPKPSTTGRRKTATRTAGRSCRARARRRLASERPVVPRREERRCSSAPEGPCRASRAEGKAGCTKHVVNSVHVGRESIRLGLHPPADPADQVVHEAVGGAAVPEADHPPDDQCRVDIEGGPGPGAAGGLGLNRYCAVRIFSRPRCGRPLWALATAGLDRVRVI